MCISLLTERTIERDIPCYKHLAPPEQKST